MDIKRTVPWFSMLEWKSVRELIYSNESSDLEQGYQTLRMWKARCPILPVGVECTMEVLRVILEDKTIHAGHDNEENISIVVLSSLELVYSSVIMRFLNFVTELKGAEVSTIYKAANELNIPDWIVNIRHDAAHGRVVPPLPLLRSATSVIFKWLYENYWKDEPNSSQEYSVSEEGEVGWKEKLTNIIDYWVSISQLHQSGVSTLEEMRVLPEGKVLYQKLNEDQLLAQFQLADSDYILLSDVRQKLLKRCHRMIEQKSSKAENDTILTAILTSENCNMLSGESNVENDALTRDWLCLWWDIIQKLSGNTFFNLLVTLKNITKESEDSFRAKMAALWLSELFKIIKNSETIKVHSKKETLSRQQIPRKDKLQPFLRDVCLHPNKTTVHYLPRLLDLLEPKLDSKKKKMIGELHKLFSGQTTEKEEESTTVYSLESLLQADPNLDIDKVSDNESEGEAEMINENIHQGPFGIWNRAQGDFGWCSCPLGIVPWQRQHTLPDWPKIAQM